MTFSRLFELGVKPDHIRQIAGQAATYIEQRLEPSVFTDAEIKEVHLEEVKQLVRKMALMKHLSSETNKF